MALYNKIFFIIWFLVFVIAQNCYGPINTEPQKKCISEIKKVFRITEEMAESRKVFASQAYLHLKISNDVNEDTFRNGKENSTYENAKAYYKHILKPGHLKVGAHFKLPEVFCQDKYNGCRFIRRKLSDKVEEVIINVYDECIAQLIVYGISLSSNGLDVIKSIYQNIVIEKINPGHKYLLDYITDNERWFQADQSMKLPSSFCSHAFPSYTQNDPSWTPVYDI